MPDRLPRRARPGLQRGWALGYLGGGLLLALNLVHRVQATTSFGVDKGMAVRISLLSAGLWWAVFTLIPVRRPAGPARRRHRRADGREPASSAAAPASSAHTFRDLRAYPQTLMFLLAYLFFNDGIQTVIASASLYGAEELQFAAGAADRHDPAGPVRGVRRGAAVRPARRDGTAPGARSCWSASSLWTVIVVARVLRCRRRPFVLFAGARRAASASCSAAARRCQPVAVQPADPAGREAEYFASTRPWSAGTSWFGTLLFGLVYQLDRTPTGSAIIALVVFFVLGVALLARVDVRQGILDAGNEVPAVV